MRELSGRIVGITGAGSGIGRALAIALARRGARLALSDRAGPAVIETAALAGAASTRGTASVREWVVDVSSADAVIEWAAAAAGHFGAVNVIVNNAGIALTGDIEAMSRADIAEVMDTNFWGVVHGTQAFLPHVIASGDGHIVNVSSVFGLIGVPSQSAYNAAKFAVRGFTEALRLEMKAAGHPVGVSCVHPGGVRTDIVRASRTVGEYDRALLADRFDRVLARSTPEQAAAAIVRGIRRDRGRVLVGADAYAIEFATRVLGIGYQRFVGRAAGRALDGQ